MRKSLLVAAAAAVIAAGVYISSPASQGLSRVNGHEFDDMSARPVAKKSGQLKFLIHVADGPGGGMVSGPMSRVEAEAEMKLYADADATLLVEDGHGGYISVGTRQPMQSLLASHEPAQDIIADSWLK